MGRDRDAEDVAKVLARSSILTLVGPPGVGKSRLAADVARRLHGSGSATVVMVDLGRATDAIAVTTLVARAIGANRLSEPADEDPTAAEGVVVVLDDCDRVAPAAAVAEALVDGGVRVLATGRRPLGADGEAVWRVPPLRLPQPGHDELPDVFIDSEAVQLFCDRAASADRGFIPISDNAEAIAEICRHLDGLPLAIELAARAVAAYSPAQIAARLGGSLSFLTRGYCTADPRHHSLEASLAWSWEMLSGPEQALLRRLSVFSGTFSDEAAAAVCVGAEVAAAKVFGLLGSLVDKSVLETVTVAGRTRYRLLHVIRLYGHGRLGSFGTELDELTARHCQYYLTAVESEGGPDTEGSRFIERLEDDHDNVGSALEWAMAADRAVDALRLGSAYVCLCWARGDHGRARSWLQRLALVAGEAPAELRSAARRAAGAAAAVQGDAAAGHLRASAAICTASHDAAGEARARNLLAFVDVVSGEAGDGLARLDEGVDAARAAADDAWVADALAVAGRAHLLVGEARVGRGYFAESLRAAERAGDASARANALVGTGWGALAQGDSQEAHAALSAGLVLARTLAEVHTEAVALVWLGESARLRGDDGHARTLFSEAAALARRASIPYPLGRALLGLARLDLDADVTGAHRRFEEALSVARASGLAFLIAPAQRGLGQLAHARGDPDAAHELLDQALQAARHFGDKGEEAAALHELGRLACSRGDRPLAASAHHEALFVWAQIGDPAGIAAALDALGQLAAAKRAAVYATRLFAAAESIRARYGYRGGWHPDEHVSAVEWSRQAMGDESFAAHWRRGTRWSTDAAVAYAVKRRGGAPRPSTGWDSLTRAERAVAELAADGRTNAQIAQELGIAPTTVKVHLRRVFPKLGLETRAGLAADKRGADG